MVKTYANQNVVTIKREETKAPFISINESSVAAAMKNLTPVQFQVWLYLIKNKNDIDWAVSPEAAEQQWGISKSSFRKAFTTLKEKGYLIQKKGSSTHFLLYELPKKVEEIQENEEKNEEKPVEEKKYQVKTKVINIPMPM